MLLLKAPLIVDGNGAKWTADTMKMQRLHLQLQEGDDNSVFVVAFRAEIKGKGKKPER